MSAWNSELTQSRCLDSFTTLSLVASGGKVGRNDDEYDIVADDDDDDDDDEDDDGDVDEDDNNDDFSRCSKISSMSRALSPTLSDRYLHSIFVTKTSFNWSEVKAVPPFSANTLCTSKLC